MSNLAEINYVENLNSTAYNTQSICMLSSTVGVQTLLYNGAVYCRPIAIISDTIEFGSTLSSIESGDLGSYPHNICALSSTTFVITYLNSSSYLYAIAGTVSGTTITLGTAIQVSTSVAISSAFSITNVASNSFVIAFYNNTNTILRAGTVSTRTITLGNAVTGYAGLSDAVNVKAISTSIFVLTNSNVDGNLVIRPCTLSTSTITLGTASTQSTYQYFLSEIEVISSTSFICTAFNSNGYFGVHICTTDGSTVTVNNFQDLFNTSVDFSYTKGYGLFLISSTLIGICYSDSYSGVNYVSTFNISGTTASLNSSDILQLSGSISTSNITYISTGVITSGSKYIICSINSNGTPLYAGYIVTYTVPSGKKCNGTTISKWNGFSPTKINSI